jgi:hypothetical protein
MESNGWISVDKIPVGVYVLIHTKTGLVRIAKKVEYANGTSSISYSSTYYKDVTHFMPLPTGPKVIKISPPKED